MELSYNENTVLGFLVDSPLSPSELAEQFKEQRIQLEWHGKKIDWQAVPPNWWKELVELALIRLRDKELAESKANGWVITEKGKDTYRGAL